MKQIIKLIITLTFSLVIMFNSHAVEEDLASTPEVQGNDHHKHLNENTKKHYTETHKRNNRRHHKNKQSKTKTTKQHKTHKHSPNKKDHNN